MHIFINFLLFTLLSTFTLSVYGYQFATIQAKKAIIYADVELSSPIGYLKRGTRVRVGEVYKKYGSVLPIAITGRLGFVLVSDLYLPTDIKNLKSKTPKAAVYKRHAIINEKQHSWSDHNYIGYSFQNFSLAGDWETLALNENDASSQIGSAYIMTLIHRSPLSRLGLEIDFGFNTISTENYEMKYPTFGTTLFFNLLSLGVVNFEICAGASYSAQVQLRKKSEVVSYENQLLETHYGGQINLFPYKKYSFSIGYFLKNIHFYNAVLTEGVDYEGDSISSSFSSLSKATSSIIQLSALYRFN